jgi:TRAP-type mannitol/chloroaromatic compound transport system permease large subunit
MIAVLMIVVLFALVFVGVPIAFAMIGTAVTFGYGIFGPAVIHQVVEKVGDVSSNFVLSAIAFFIFMGCMLE